MTAILRYNNSVAYARNVLGWAAAYATGVVPVDLPPITGPIPPIADVHLDNYRGLGPGLPLNALGLPANDPLALVPLVDMGRTDVASQIPTTANGPMFGPLPGPAEAMTQPDPAQNLPPWMQPPPQQNCAVFCLGTNPPPPVQPQLPPEALPPGIVAPPAAPAEIPPPAAGQIAPPPPADVPATTPALPVPRGVGPAPGPAA